MKAEWWNVEWNYVIFILILILISTLLVVCWARSTKENEINEEELRLYDGVQNKNIYIACNGYIFDVTNISKYIAGHILEKYKTGELRKFWGKELIPPLEDCQTSEELFKKLISKDKLDIVGRYSPTLIKLD